MNIAIDISPLETGHFLQHRVRGTGFYLDNLKKSLLRYHPENSYTFFTRGRKLPKNIDLVHYPYFEPFFLTLPVFRSYKTVVTVHDLTPFVFPREFPAGLKGRAKWQIQKQALKSVDAIITDSLSSKKDVIKHGGISDARISVVYLAASAEFKRINDKGLMIKEILKKYNLPQKFVLYVGDATWNKNVPRLIQAVRRAKIPLVMAGKALVDSSFDRSNPWNKDLVAIHEMTKGAKDVIRLGFVPGNDLVALYNGATVFAMPSIYEGFGLPILEAMRCGCPVVTSKEGSISEVAQGAAFYVDAYDVDSIAKGLKTVYESKDLQQKYSAKGLIQAKKFSWKKTAEQTVKVYESIFT